MSMTLYGIKNCDTVRKARRFLDEHGIAYRFHDFRETPVGCDTITRWLQKVPTDRLFNARSAAYRAIDPDERPTDDEAKKAWLCHNNTLIKRPVIETKDGKVLVGFDPNLYKETFA